MIGGRDWGWRSTFSSLENREYRWYWLSGTFTAATMQMNVLARGWLVYELTDSYGALGQVSFGAGLPLLLLSPFGGAIADRVDKRALIIASQLLTSLAMLVIAVLVQLDMVEVWHLIITAVATGTALAFNLPSRQAMVPQLVERHQIMNAVALNSGSQNVNRIVAPAVGGVLIGFAGIGEVYFITVVLSLVSVGLMFFVRPRETPQSAGRAPVARDIVAGMRYVRHSSALWGLMVMATVPILFGMPYVLLLPGFAKDVLGADSAGLGYLMAAAGAGAGLGTLVMARLGDHGRKGLLLLVTCIAFGAALSGFAVAGGFGLALAMLLGVGMSNAAYLVLNNSLLLLNSTEEMRGRVMGLYTMTIALLPIAAWPVGTAMDSADPVPVFLACGLIIVVFTIMMAGFNSRLRSL